MHEYSLAQAMMDKVEQEARAHHAVAVHSLQVRIGRQCGVEADLFATAYEMLRPGTLCENAELIITREEGRWLCDACGRELPPASVLACPECSWPARLAEGGDLILERIELEVPNV
jgi:hydrogenase nickel incorporation protein HypA/HybF